jgi:hypothetical protein
VRATFSGTLDRIVMTGGDGSIVSKGQPLFKITPDEKFVALDPKEVERERRARTGEHLKAVLATAHQRFGGIEVIEVERDRRSRLKAG